LRIDARIDGGKMKRRIAAQLTLVAVALAAAGAAGCSGGNGGEKSQVVARVNGSEITVSQLLAALAAKGDAEPTAEAARQALDGLVNEQLLVDAALANDLDRDPVVLQAVEAARRQMLARAYLERAVFPKQEIGAAEQTAYYRNNPALFAERRVYQLAAFTVATNALTPDVVNELGSTVSAEGVVAVLESHRVHFEEQNLTRAAEQLPLEHLPKFSAAGVGDVVIQPRQGDKSVLMVVTDVHSAPLAFDSAQPVIQQYLANVRNAEALDAHLKLARAAATITSSDPALVVVAAAPQSQTESGPAESRVDRGAAVLN
jgi:EpsD family peptidyl-prolyl cis-trans isomerase